MASSKEDIDPVDLIIAGRETCSYQKTTAMPSGIPPPAPGICVETSRWSSKLACV